MKIKKGFFPRGLLVFPNTRIGFGEIENDCNPLELIRMHRYGNVAHVGFTRCGALAVVFDSRGPLKSIEYLQTEGSGHLPDTVFENNERVKNLQFKRFEFANYLAGAIFGRFSALTHSALRGSHYISMSEALSCDLTCAGSLDIPAQPGLKEAIISQCTSIVRSGALPKTVSASQLEAIASFLDHLQTKEENFKAASLQRCILLNYQAAILHEQQQPSASLAVNFTVAEALIDEIFWAKGIVQKGYVGHGDSGQCSTFQMSRNDFRELLLDGKLEHLCNYDVIGHHLHDRLSTAKSARNDLLHRHQTAELTQSGNLQTAVRDLWAELIDFDFELNAPFEYRL